MSIMTSDSLPDDFSHIIARTLRPPSPPPEGIIRVAHLFCGNGDLSLAAKDAGMEVVYAEEPDERLRAEYERNTGLAPKNISRAIPFKDIPAFDLLLATLPADDAEREKALTYAYRFLYIRRPRAFLFVGEGVVAPDAEALTQDKAGKMGYEVMAGAVPGAEQYFVLGAVGRVEADFNHFGGNLLGEEPAPPSLGVGLLLEFLAWYVAGEGN